MATSRRFTGGFGRLPSRTKVGSTAFHNKKAAQAARESMATVIRNYESLIKRFKSATPSMIHDALMPAFNKSQVYVPKKTGALMSSGRLDVFPGLGGEPEAQIMYGDSGAPYAAIVHEATWLNHASPTQSKYLQRALEEEMDSFLTSLAVDYATLL